MERRARRKLLSLGLGALALALPPEPARASCGRDADATVVPPPLGVPAPRNVKPRITLHADWRTRSFCPPWRDRPCLAGRFELALRVAGNDANDRIDATFSESTSGEIATVTIAPRVVLPPNRRFEVVQTEKDAREPARIVGTFVTGDRIDEQPPTWTGVTGSSAIGLWPGREQPRGARKRVVILDDLLCIGPGVLFHGTTAATDDATRDEDLRYAVWAGDPNGTIDYAAPPLAYERATLELLRGGGSRMVVRFGGTPSPSDFSFPNEKRARKFGLRAVDLAGNLSEPSELVVHAP